MEENAKTSLIYELKVQCHHMPCHKNQTVKLKFSQEATSLVAEATTAAERENKQLANIE